MIHLSKKGRINKTLIQVIQILFALIALYLVLKGFGLLK